MDHIWNLGFTTYDKKIIEYLSSISKALYEHFTNEGSVHIYWGGELVEYKFAAWSFENDDSPERASLREILQRCDQKVSLINKKDLFTRLMEKEDFTLKSMLEIIQEVKRQFPTPLNFTQISVNRVEKIKKWNPFKLLYYHTFKVLSKSDNYLETLLQDLLAQFEEECPSGEDLQKWISEKIEWDEPYRLASLMENSLIESFVELDSLESNYREPDFDFPSLKQAITMFKNDFFHLPVEYLGGQKKIEASLFNGFLGMFSSELTPAMNVAANFFKRKEPLIIDGQGFAGYALLLNLIPHDELDRFGTYSPFYSPFIQNEDVTVIDLMVYYLITLIRLRLEILDNQFNKVFENLKNNTAVSKLFKTETEILKYLKNYFKSIRDNKSLIAPILLRFKFPDAVESVALECIINLLDKKICKKEGYTSETLLVPDSLESMLKGGSEFDKMALTTLDQSRAVERDFFSKTKIEWPLDRKELLEDLFSQFYIQTNKAGKPFLKKDEVRIILNSNFSCYSIELKPIPFNFLGKPTTLLSFAHLLYSILDGQIHKTRKIGKVRIAQFVVQNFIQYSEWAADEERLQQLMRHIRRSKDKPLESIDLKEVLTKHGITY